MLGAGRDAPKLADRGRSRGLTNHELRLNGDLGNVFAAALDEIDDGLRGDLPHFYKWLPDGGQAGIGVRCSGNIVEAHNRNVFRHTQACFVERPDRADGRNVVVSKKCRERMLPSQELLGEGISNAGRRIEALQLDGQLGTNANTELLGHFADRAPTHRGIRTHRLPSNEGDFLVAQIAKMFQCQPRGPRVVQDDVGYAIDELMSRHGNGRQGNLLSDRSVRSDETLDATRQKHLRIGLQELRIMPVDHRQEEIIVLAQIFFDAADHHRAVGVPDFFGNYADCISSLQAQGASKKVRTIIERLRGFDDAIFCVRRNRAPNWEFCHSKRADAPISRDSSATWQLPSKPWMQAPWLKFRPRVGIVLHLYG